MATQPRIASRVPMLCPGGEVVPVRSRGPAVLLLAVLGCANQPLLESPPVALHNPLDPAVKAAPTPRTLTAAPVPTRGTLPEAIAPAAGPVAFEAVAPDARWVVFCQARTDTDGDGQLRVSIGPQGELIGDRLERYLAFDSGTEEPVEDLLASSPDGRFIAIKRGSQSELIDITNGLRTDLSATEIDTRRDPTAVSQHRAIVLDDTTLFYVRRGTAQQEIVERSLIDGSERLLYRAAEPILRIALDATRRALVASVPGADVNGNGRFDPTYPAVDGPKPCLNPLPRYMAPRVGVDPIGFVVIDRESRSATRVDDLAIVFGQGILRRELSGALVLDRAGQRLLIGDAACKGRILWADPSRDAILVGCATAKKSGRLRVELVAAGKRTSLDIEVAALALDEPVRHGERLVPLYPGADTVLFDADKKTLRRLQSGDGVLGTSGSRALIRRGKTAILYDADADAETLLAGSLDPLPVILRRGPLVFSSPLLVDLATGRELGSLPGRPLALASSGALLLPVRPATSMELAEGPLTWNVVH